MKIKIIAQGNYEIASVLIKDSCCVKTFLDGLDNSFRSNVADFEFMLEYIATNGFNNLPPGWSHEIDKGAKLFELRKGRLRIPYFRGSGNRIIICGPGFVKKTQKTPESVKQEMKELQDEYRKNAASGKLKVIKIDSEGSSV